MKTGASNFACDEFSVNARCHGGSGGVIVTAKCVKGTILAGVLLVGVVGEDIIRYSESILFLFYIRMDSTHYEAHPI